MVDLNSSSGSKLRKFNVNATSSLKAGPNAADEAELKRRQEEIRLSNEAEKERNRRIIQELIVAKDAATGKSNTDAAQRLVRALFDKWVFELFF